MIEKSITLNRPLPRHRFRFRYNRKRALKAMPVYEYYIRDQLMKFSEALKIVPNLSDNLSSIDVEEIDVNVEPSFYKQFSIMEYCDLLEGSVCFKINISHEDVNLLKLKNPLFYDYYIKDEYDGIYSLISEMMHGFLLHIVNNFDYELSKGTYKNK